MRSVFTLDNRGICKRLFKTRIFFLITQNESSWFSGGQRHTTRLIRHYEIVKWSVYKSWFNVLNPWKWYSTYRKVLKTIVTRVMFSLCSHFNCGRYVTCVITYDYHFFFFLNGPPETSNIPIIPIVVKLPKYQTNRTYQNYRKRRKNENTKTSNIKYCDNLYCSEKIIRCALHFNRCT